MFYLPTFALGMWPLTLFLLFSGPFLGRVLTTHQDEIPAIWCFFSIAQLFFPLVWAYATKTAMFAPAKQPVAMDKKVDDQPTAIAAVTKDEDDEEEPIPNLGTSIKRAIQLFAALTLKRYITIWLAPSAAAAAVGVAK